ncbi:WD repeat, SAM and U-box domain-containing protein 1-like [Babylonia areolata]|uniref:WD repeat, SAM and U-box domain-containing protein 1-like n=1 Tax=Babylonia areolata TaxID=304850 RepID=UPI003FD0A8E5
MANMVASLIHTITTHTGDITGVAFTQGKLATTSTDKTVRLWSLEDFSELPCSPLLGHSYNVHGCDFSALGSMLATCSTDGKVIVWDVKTGAVKVELQHASKSSIRVCKFSPSSSYVVSGSDDDTICMWEVATQKLVRSYVGHEDSVMALTVSPDGYYLVSGTPNGDLYVWDAAFGHGRYLSLKVNAHDLGVTCCEFSPTFGTAGEEKGSESRLLLATGGKDNLVKLWTFRAQVGSPEVRLKCHNALPGHTDIVMSCAFSPSGSLLASGSLDKSVRLWDPVKGVALFSIDACHTRFVTCCAFSSDGRLLASGSMDHSVKIWKLTDTRTIMEGLKGYEEPEEEAEATILNLPNPVEGWTVEDVVQWLDTQGLGQYQQAFRENAIDGKELLALAPSDLETTLGVSALGHRKKILRDRQHGHTVLLSSSVDPDALASLSAGAEVCQPGGSKDHVKPGGQWAVEDVAQWLDTLGLQQYVDSFRRNAIDGTELLALTDKDLEMCLGVAALGHRRKILRGRDPEADVRKGASPAEKSAGQAKDTVEGLNELLCPITMEMMRDPVIAADGYTYDRRAIQQWLESGKDRSPMTNAVLSHKHLTPNHTLKMLIHKHLEQAKK